MFADTDFISYDFMTDFNGPLRHFPNEFYPSGVYDGEKREYKYGPESVKYPTLILPCELQDSHGNSIPDGYYTATVSPERKYIHLYQGIDLKARIKIIKLTEKMYTDEERFEEESIRTKMEDAKNRKKLKKYREAEEELIAFKQRVNANSYAEIKDSGNGYYIIIYNMQGIKAEGIVYKQM